ncbi:MAG: hypothetical protein AAF393_04780 [Pseudomonadota bacterium]
MRFHRLFLAITLLCAPGLAAGQAAVSKSEVFEYLQGNRINAGGNIVTEIRGEIFSQYVAFFDEAVEKKGSMALQRICPVNNLKGPILVFRAYDNDTWCYKLVLVERDRAELVETELENPDTWYRSED